MHYVRSLHTLGMHIDPAPEEQEIPVIEEPRRPGTELQQEEYPQAAPDFTADDTDPSEEGMEFLFCACVGGGACYHQE
ncbi:hypothetical protein U9M48_031274 [Paspalum notatum var. saurae]|uniref:Uncharacterized protein n=1 Tax=Paspalum notatum var. saurae TaxID=547442 RepID=A0AAQ3X4L1_PASNO